ncbi:methionine ABC transporter permease [Microbacterium saperdae]|uniref:D-methionine transport system permease protein n=1 Tax=Microbacterium saperdae TaxID=69368 RepID=A0A543BPN3_9MICO|nr:methionine ABC transporter permease [Microbacterium saperdae]TQL86795.1 D-methionine transport system permease protein [Microbacterium saperdae]GGM45346.1 ABC transporter permease [Microbacterium saperdae]
MIDTLLTPELFFEALGETLYMLGISLFFGSILGILLGIAVVVTRPTGVLPNAVASFVLNAFINVVRSLPFIILLVAILPFTRLVVGTSIGVNGALVPLILMVAPYIGRLVENSLLEVPEGIVEAAKSMGATPVQIFVRFLLPEARGSLVLALTTATIGLLDATAMAGTVGAGGIGDLAISYGYQRFDGITMLVTVVTLVVIVQLIQLFGTRLARKLRRR